MATRVTVIGAGVVGLTSAWWLLQAGFRVRLIDRAAAPGEGASYANGGQLSYRYVSPLADAGVPLKALRWLMQRDGPLRFHPQADPQQWRWLLQFLRHCNNADNARSSAILLELAGLSRQSLASLEPQLPLHAIGWRQPGKLLLYRDRAQFAAAVAAARPSAAASTSAAPAALLSESDGQRQYLSPDQALALEPALATLHPSLAGAIFDPGEAVADCHAFCLALLDQIRTHPDFDGMLQTQALGLRSAPGRALTLETTAGTLDADHFVLAAGIHSRALAASAGLSLPLYPLKGYSLSAPVGPRHRAPSISVTDVERKVLYARIGDQLRVAAMVDLAGMDSSIAPSRLASLQRLVRAAMPDAADYERAIPWAGLRPATPSGLPIIGATGHPGLWLNLGHGALGFTLACGSASLLADLMLGRQAPPALATLAWRG